MVNIVTLLRLVPLIWDWFGRISICFLIQSNTALALQSFLFTNYWSNLLWCIVRCFLWWANVAVGWVFCLFIIAICRYKVSYLLWQFIDSFSILLNPCTQSAILFFLINWNMTLEIKFWFSFLYWNWDKNIKISGFPIFKISNIEIQIWSLFLVFHFNLKNEKPNLLKQISYETSYHSPYANIMNKCKRKK